MANQYNPGSLTKACLAVLRINSWSDPAGELAKAMGSEELRVISYNPITNPGTLNLSSPPHILTIFPITSVSSFVEADVKILSAPRLFNSAHAATNKAQRISKDFSFSSTTKTPTSPSLLFSCLVTPATT